MDADAELRERIFSLIFPLAAGNWLSLGQVMIAVQQVEKFLLTGNLPESEA